MGEEGKGKGGLVQFMQKEVAVNPKTGFKAKDFDQLKVSTY